MRNIWFTIYSRSKDDEKFIGLRNYRTLLEILLIPAIQDKLNRDKKAQKIMFCLLPDLEEDLIDSFVKNYSNKKKLNQGIINLEASSKGINWNILTDQEKKNFLIEKWKILFNNLSDDYFVTDKSEVLKSLEELKDQEWKITSKPFKKKLKYNKEIFNVVIDISVERLELAIERESDGKWYKLKEYEAWKMMTDANFKNFKLDGDSLIIENSSIFGAPEVFDLKSVLNTD
jgi:hypothetical protein